ncbi:hypothetical protein [Yoonia sp. SS1-5]|uniref:Uncharacterized protein n=1 Tax=Yoonia rhodophyticola TaxID=3137370 RepID=A0AAN0M9A7_9RHOB
MNENASPLIPHDDGTLFSRLSDVIREVGVAVAEIEETMVDEVQFNQRARLPSHTVQKIDVVMQSIEEIALIVERMSLVAPECLERNRFEIVNPAKLEWIRTVLLDDETKNASPELDRCTGTVTLF